MSSQWKSQSWRRKAVVKMIREAGQFDAAAVEDTCWLCGDRMLRAGAKLIRARNGERLWLAKSVCRSCSDKVRVEPDQKAEIEGDVWMLRPWVLIP